MSALADLLTLAAIGLAYWVGRNHQSRTDARAWSEYGRWLKARRSELAGRFVDIRA